MSDQRRCPDTCPTAGGLNQNIYGFGRSLPSCPSWSRTRVTTGAGEVHKAEKGEAFMSRKT